MTTKLTPKQAEKLHIAYVCQMANGRNSYSLTSGRFEFHQGTNHANYVAGRMSLEDYRQSSSATVTREGEQ